jgi:hypothetical protein
VQGLLFAFFTIVPSCAGADVRFIYKEFFPMQGRCSLYLQTVPCCAGAAVRFINKLFLAVQGLLFALFKKSFFHVQGLLFALFTSIMFGTQVSAIWYDETGIEALKKEEAR